MREYLYNEFVGKIEQGHHRSRRKLECRTMPDSRLPTPTTIWSSLSCLCHSAEQPSWYITTYTLVCSHNKVEQTAGIDRKVYRSGRTLESDFLATAIMIYHYLDSTSMLKGLLEWIARFTRTRQSLSFTTNTGDVLLMPQCWTAIQIYHCVDVY